MTASQATDALAEACARADVRTWGSVKRRRLAVAACARHAPSREHIFRNGLTQCHEELKAAAKQELGSIIGIFIGAVIWDVLVSCVAWLILKWIFRADAKATLIQQARGQA